MKTVLSILMSFPFLFEVSFAQDLGITLNDYTPNQNLTSGKIQTAFTVTNYGPSTLQSGAVVYAGTKINGTYYNLSLTNSGGTAITMKRNIAVNDTFMYNPGYLDGALTLSFLNTTSVQVCLLVYGVGATSVGANFPSDPNPSNNTDCVTYGASNTATGISDDLLSNNIKIFPVPTSGLINIETSNISVNKIQFLDLTGRVMKEENIHGSPLIVDISNFGVGVYFYRLYSNENIIKTDRIIVN